jgi:hypothetical protein
MMTTPEKLASGLAEKFTFTGEMRELSFTGLKEFMKSPADFIEYLVRKENNQEGEWKEYFSDGHLFEFFFLNGCDADPSKKFYIADKKKMPMPSADFRTKANKAWLNDEQVFAQICGKTFCFLAQVENAKKQARACKYPKVWLYPNAKATYQLHRKGTIFGVPFHGHIDLFVEIGGQKIVYDTKCTGKSLGGEKGAKYYITDAKTHVQMLIYKHLCGADTVKVIVSESLAPYNYYAFELISALDRADETLRKACEDYLRWYKLGCPISNNSFFGNTTNVF